MVRSRIEVQLLGGGREIFIEGKYYNINSITSGEITSEGNVYVLKRSVKLNLSDPSGKCYVLSIKRGSPYKLNKGLVGHIFPISTRSHPNIRIDESDSQEEVIRNYDPKTWVGSHEWEELMGISVGNKNGANHT